MRSLTMRAPGRVHSAPVTSVSLHPTEALLASASYDGTAIVWDVSQPDAPRQVTTLSHRRLINSVTWNPYREAVLATASADKTVAVWDVSDGSAELLSVAARHTDDVNSVAWMPDGARFVCVSEDGRASLWNAEASRYEGMVASHAAHCMMVDISGAGLVLTVGEDGLVAVNDLEKNETAERSYDGSVEGCSWSRSGDQLAIVRDDGHLDVLGRDLETRLSVKVASSAARAVAWSDDDRSLVVGCYDGRVYLIDADSGDIIRSAYDERFWPRSVSVAGDVVAVGSFWGGVHLLDRWTLTPRSSPGVPTHGVNALTPRPGTDDLLVGADSGLVAAVPFPTARRSGGTPQLVGEVVSPVLSVAWDGERGWAGTYAGDVRELAVEPRVSGSLGAPVPSLIATPDRLVAGTYNGELVELDKRTLDVVRRRNAHDGSIKSLAVLPNTDQYLSAATDRTVALGDFERRSVLWEHGNLVNAVAANADGTVVASASRDHTVKVARIVDGGVGGPVLSLLGADESMKAVAVLGDADQPIVVAGSYDFGIYMWRVDWRQHDRLLRSGRRLRDVGQGVSAVCAVDARRCVVAGWDGSLVFFEVVDGELVETADVDTSGLFSRFATAGGPRVPA